MNEPKEDAADRLVEVDLELDLNKEQLAQLDKLIEEQAMPTRRLTREEMLRLLVERGSDQVAQGASLLPYLEAPASGDEEAPASTCPPTPDNTTKH
ncbi:MAG: hypothetical protein ACMG6S_32890 [Byssovorax sp.]